MMPRCLCTLTTILALLAAPGAFGQSPPEPPSQVCKNAAGVAAGGYDVVSYFADNAPRPGNPRIVARHGGAEYRFATLAHRERFLANPQSYLPQFGGHCAYGMGKGKLLTGDPQSWLVHKGKLYLLSSREALAAFQANLAVAIEQADRIWKRLY